jgi:hypothetical protein
MVEDVHLSLNGARPVEFLSRVGGNVPSHDDVLRFVQNQARRYLTIEKLEEERMANV